MDGPDKTFAGQSKSWKCGTLHVETHKHYGTAVLELEGLGVVVEHQETLLKQEQNVVLTKKERETFSGVVRRFANCPQGTH